MRRPDDAPPPLPQPPQPPASGSPPAGTLVLHTSLLGDLRVQGDPEQAAERFAAGEWTFEPCHHHDAVGPMAGVVSPSMWLFVLEDPATGRRTYCSLNEGLGKVLRYGAYGPEVLDRLRPDVWAKGGDYAGADLPEAAVLRRWGGQAVVLPYLDGHSTTALVERSRS